jgi:predicted FMN-binding regulatory protein PaiB
MLIVQGVHGYISPSWYAPGAYHNPRLADEMERALASEPSG